VRLTRLLIAFLTSWHAIALVDLLLLGCGFVILQGQFRMPAEGGSMQLETESFGTLLVAWGVILEAREVAVERCRTYKCPHEGLDEALNAVGARFGLGILCLGLMIEGLNAIATASDRGLLHADAGGSARYLAWLPFLIGLFDLASNAVLVTRLRCLPSIRAANAAPAVGHD
jgi:hypothetical protein